MHSLFFSSRSLFSNNNLLRTKEQVLINNDLQTQWPDPTQWSPLCWISAPQTNDQINKAIYNRSEPQNIEMLAQSRTWWKFPCRLDRWNVYCGNISTYSSHRCGACHGKYNIKVKDMSYQGPSLVSGRPSPQKFVIAGRWVLYFIHFFKFWEKQAIGNQVLT